MYVSAGPTSMISSRRGEWRRHVELQPGPDRWSVSAQVTSTILARDRTFIPIPDEIAGTFLPQVGERKRLEVHSDIL
jgi:hypothetical protein